MSKNKTEFFLDHLLLFFVSFEKKAQKKRTQKKDRREQNFHHTFEKRAKFELFSLCPRARILPKTIKKKRRESKQKHKRFASLKISLPLFVVFVAL